MRVRRHTHTPANISLPIVRAELAPLQISSAKEIEVKGGRKAIVMWVDDGAGVAGASRTDTPLMECAESDTLVCTLL